MLFLKEEKKNTAQNLRIFSVNEYIYKIFQCSDLEGLLQLFVQNLSRGCKKGT